MSERIRAIFPRLLTRSFSVSLGTQWQFCSSTHRKYASLSIEVATLTAARKSPHLWTRTANTNPGLLRSSVSRIESYTINVEDGQFQEDCLGTCCHNQRRFTRRRSTRRGSRGSIDPVVQYQAFHARSDWYITMIFIIICPSGH
jgi:hypothetical protein